MTELTVLSDSTMGPLDVSVYPPGADAIEFALSSGQTSKQLTVAAGQYAIVAQRPNGARLHQVVTVMDTAVTVDLSQRVGSSPNEFMEAETRRGQVKAEPDALSPDRSTGWRAALAGSAGASIANAALLSVGLGVWRTPFPLPAATANVALDLLRLSRPQQTFSLCLWRLDDVRGWCAARRDGGAGPSVEAIEVSGDFVKVTLDPRQNVLALGLLDEKGFGPIVNVLPMAERLDVTFLAKGVFVQAADRRETPGGQRVAVAFTTPSNQAAADLLSALAAPATVRAADLWDQVSGGLAHGPLGMPTDVAFTMLLQKFRRPAEALLAAHFLLRFLPSHLPIAWADNLVRAMPLAADGPVIAAWVRVLNRPPDASDEEIDTTIDRNISLALDRPVVLFARTRALLFDGLRLAAAETAAKGRAAETRYRRFGADAGGPESFWGAGPTAPGATAQLDPLADLATITLTDGLFARSRAGTLDPEPSAAMA